MNKIWLQLHEHYLLKPVSASRIDALDTLLEKNKDSDKKLICVDWTDFTDKVKIIWDEQIKKIFSVLLLPSWYDSVIANTKEKVELALPVWDCGLLTAYHKNWSWEYNILWNAHLGYKWVIADWDLEKNWIIENFLNSLMQEANTKNLDDFEFFLAPMAWNNFELPKKYFYEKIAPFIEKQNKDIVENYKLSPEDFIKKSDNIYNDWEERIYFDLKKLILYILINKHSLKIYKENIDPRSTTDPRNKLPSFRSHTIAKNIPIEAILSSQKYKKSMEILRKNNRDIDHNISFLGKLLGITKEQAWLIFYEVDYFYKYLNSRLSLNIFTK